MGYFKNVIFLSCFLLASIFCSAVAQQEFLKHFCINETGNYTDGSTYQKNLENLLTSLPFGIDSYGYNHSTVGEDPDRVNAVVLCRGDVNPDSCQECVNRSIPMLKGLCTTSNDAVGWLDYCMLRYSSQPLTGIESISENQTFWLYNNETNATNPEQFNKDVQSLLEALKPEAAGGGARKKFAFNNRMGPDFQPIYAIVQCTPDLSLELCSNCLTRTFSLYPNCCNGRVGGRVITPNCNFRYENNSFFNQTKVETDVPPPPPPPPPRPGITKIVIIVVSVSASSVFLVAIFAVWRRRRNSRGMHKRLQEDRDVDLEDMSKNEQVLRYEFDDIKVATDDFSEANKLGKGGFGAVYKGKFPNGQEFAVKRLSSSNGQGDAEFKNEVMLVAKLQHRNLVRILGYSLQGPERLLVYELLTNSSLDQFIFDSNKRTQLDWEMRYKIIVGIARGLLYLHEDSRHRIIHRDLKAGNVLLDAEMNPKIADFGMAKLSSMDETHGNTRRIAGTYGYMAPEYALQGKFSVKSDVFSFGVLILEIISGQKNSSFTNEENGDGILSFAWRSWNEGNGLNLIDPAITNTGGLVRDILRCVHIALLCCQDNPVDRPAMASVVVMLTSFSITLPIPFEPRGLFKERINTNTSRSDIIAASNNGVTISDLNPR